MRVSRVIVLGLLIVAAGVFCAGDAGQGRHLVAERPYGPRDEVVVPWAEIVSDIRSGEIVVETRGIGGFMSKGASRRRRRGMRETARSRRSVNG